MHATRPLHNNTTVGKVAAMANNGMSPNPDTVRAGYYTTLAVMIIETQPTRGALGRRTAGQQEPAYVET